MTTSNQRSSSHVSVPYESIAPLSHDDSTFEALYTINRHAKRFDVAAKEAYTAGDGMAARIHSVRKTALYRVKTIAIHRLIKAAPGRVTVSRHVLNGNREMYCFDFAAGYSFHQPPAAIDDAVLTVLDESDDRAEPISFERSTDTQDCPLELHTALTTLAARGIDANELLDTESVLDWDEKVRHSTTFGCLETD